MNQARRKSLQKARDDIQRAVNLIGAFIESKDTDTYPEPNPAFDRVPVITLITNAMGIVEEAKDEEQDYFDNMPESFQNGDKGEAAEEAISYMEDSAQALDNAMDEIKAEDADLDLEVVDDALNEAIEHLDNIL